jgi:YYY domain-containing protein
LPGGEKRLEKVFPLFSTVFNQNVLLWWLTLEILGLAALPIAFRSMRWLPDRGYTFSKVLGLLIASYLLWMGAMTGFLRNDTGGILFAILAVFGLSAILMRKKMDFNELVHFVREKKRLIIVVELLFAAAFIAWVILRAYAPEKVMSAGGEKFMEMAFLNGVLNSPRFPPMDVWLSGFGISYYYFGYIMMGLLTRITGALAGVGFELYDALLFALTILGVFGVVYNLAAKSILEHRQVNQNHPKAKSSSTRQPVLYGLLGSALVVIMGNMEGLLESLYTRGILPESFWRWIDIPGLVGSPVTGEWVPGGGFFGCCWRASRVLQDYDLAGQPVGVSPITEFPMFSFLLGDNHPHVLALPFALLMVALAFNLLLRQATVVPNRNDQNHQADHHDSHFSIRDIFDNLLGEREQWGLWLFYAFCLGALGFLNTWDMPIYLGLVALAYGTGEYARQRKLDWGLVLRTCILAVSLLIAAVLFYILFYLGFQSQAGGILPYVFKPTLLPQYLVMFGPFIYILLWYLTTTAIQKARQEGKTLVIRTFLAAWMWIGLACFALIALFLLVIFLTYGTGQLQNPLVQNMLGGGTINQAIQRFLAARFSAPWLFLLLTGLLALSLANLFQKKATEESGAPLPETLDSSAARKTGSYSAELFTFLLILLGVGLTLSVEILYLRDSFGVRMNTIFKFYYQAWIMLGCASAYAIWWLLNPGKAILGAFSRGVFLAGAILLVSAAMVYPMVAGVARVDGFRGTPDLDGTANLALSNPGDWAAIAWLKTNIPAANDPTSVVLARDIPTILEAPGKSYNYEGRISAFSGFPTLLGWAYHEAQWRGNYDEQGRREPDIQTIYTTKSGDLALELLRKWKVKYVVLGPSEINYIQQLCTEPNRACKLSRALHKFETSLIPVFRQGNTTIYQAPETGQ